MDDALLQRVVRLSLVGPDSTIVISNQILSSVGRRLGVAELVYEPPLRHTAYAESVAALMLHLRNEGVSPTGTWVVMVVTMRLLGLKERTTRPVSYEVINRMCLPGDSVTVLSAVVSVLFGAKP